MSELAHIRPILAFIFLVAGLSVHCAEDTSSSEGPSDVEGSAEEVEDASDTKGGGGDAAALEPRAEDILEENPGSADGVTGPDAEPYHPPVFGGAPQLGVDGDVTYEVLLAHPWIWDPTDVAFDPNHPERMWVTSRADDAFVLLDGPDSLPQKFVDYYHVYADEVSALSFSRDGTFASCQESMNTYNGSLVGDGVVGPTLWSADPAVFDASEDSTPGGTHIDSLTGSALCMGIGWVRDNAFYVFDGEKGDLELFDFQRPYAPGVGDPAGGIKYRILSGELLREPGVPSHMVFHAPSNRLFIADTGNQRILWLDVTSGEPGTTIFANLDPGTTYKKWVNAVWDVWMNPGMVVMPSGMALSGDRLFVGDHATGEILAFDLEGTLLNVLDTGRGPDALGGIAVDAKGRVVFVDMLQHEVIRVEP